MRKFILMMLTDQELREEFEKELHHTPRYADYLAAVREEIERRKQPAIVRASR